jgi:CheY-like chemotaxis protein
MLEKMGHTTVLAINGREALATLAAGTFDLVFMDVQMPEIDGLSATREVRLREKQTGCHIPIVAMTAHAVSGDRERCLESGMDAYISKPVTSHGIAKTIAEIFVADSQVQVLPIAPFVSASASLWDRHKALERVDGDEPLLRELVQIFLEESPKQLTAMRRAIESANLEAIERTAHSLKGELGYLGLPAAAQKAKDLERMGHERTLQPAAELFSTFQAEVAAVAGDLQRMLEETKEAVDR